jgi:hypothetical protein
MGLFTDEVKWNNSGFGQGGNNPEPSDTHVLIKRTVSKKSGRDNADLFIVEMTVVDCKALTAGEPAPHRKGADLSWVVSDRYPSAPSNVKNFGWAVMRAICEITSEPPVQSGVTMGWMKKELVDEQGASGLVLRFKAEAERTKAGGLFTKVRWDLPLPELADPPADVVA